MLAVGWGGLEKKRSNPLPVALKDLPGRNVFRLALCNCILLGKKT